MTDEAASYAANYDVEPTGERPKVATQCPLNPVAPKPGIRIKTVNDKSGWETHSRVFPEHLTNFSNAFRPPGE